MSHNSWEHAVYPIESKVFGWSGHWWQLRLPCWITWLPWLPWRSGQSSPPFVAIGTHGLTNRFFQRQQMHYQIIWPHQSLCEDAHGKHPRKIPMEDTHGTYPCPPCSITLDRDLACLCAMTDVKLKFWVAHVAQQIACLSGSNNLCNKNKNTSHTR